MMHDSDSLYSPLNESDTRFDLIARIISSVHEAQHGDFASDLDDQLRAHNISLDPEELEMIDERFVALILGDKREQLTTVIPITVIYSIIFITGVVGNFCTCLVIIRNKYMRTVTNYYLFNLSISDLLLLLLGLPQEVYNTWSMFPFPFGEAFCRFRFWASEVSSNVSVLTITAFTVERYMAICHPIKFPTHPGLSRPLRVMAVVWTLSSLWAIPMALQMGIVYKKWRRENIPESAECNMLNPTVGVTVFQVSTLLFFIIPMSVIALLYFFIALAIRRSTLNRAGSDSSNDGSRSHVSCDIRQNTTSQQHARIRQSVLKMLVAVVVAFFLCWAPFHTQRLLAVYFDELPTQGETAHQVVLYVSGITYYLSATVNPVLYSIMSLKFRQAFRATLLCCCWWARSRPKRRINRNSYTFKFQHRAYVNTHCSVVESSSSTNNNNKQQQNNQQSSSPSTPVLCCVTGNGGVTTHLENRPLVGIFACDSPRRLSFESHCPSQPDTVERML